MAHPQMIADVENILSLGCFSNEDFFRSASQKKNIHDLPALMKSMDFTSKKGKFDNIEEDMIEYQKTLIAFKNSIKTHKDRRPLKMAYSPGVERSASTMEGTQKLPQGLPITPSTSSGASYLKSVDNKLTRKVNKESSIFSSPSPDNDDFDFVESPRLSRAAKDRALNTIESIKKFESQDNDGRPRKFFKSLTLRKSIKEKMPPSASPSASQKKEEETGTCPMCEKVLAMSDLEEHAANCNGSPGPSRERFVLRGQRCRQCGVGYTNPNDHKCNGNFQ